MGCNKWRVRTGLLVLLSTPLSAAAPEIGAATSTVIMSTVPVISSTFSWRSVPNHAFEPGEKYNFVVTWGVITGGQSSLSIEGTEPVGARPAYHIVSEAKSGGILDTFYHVEDRNEAWLDVQSLLTVRYEKHIHEGKYRIEETGTLDQEHHHYAVHAYRIDKNRYDYKQGDLTPDILDVLGSFYYVRTLPLAVGQSYTIDVFSGEKVWPLVVKVKKREKIKVPAGKFDCFLVEPFLREPGIFITKGKKLEVWMTADERHIPVRMRSEVFIGHVSAELVSYQTVSPTH